MCALNRLPWKVYPVHTYREGNDSNNYFADRVEAEQEANARNLNHQNWVNPRRL